MKKILLTALAIAGIATAQAQISIGPIAGGHLAKYSNRINGINYAEASRSTANWRLGVAANVPISNHWALQPSATYATMYIVSPKAAPKNTRVDPNALEVPVCLAYKFTPGHNTLMLSAGPTVAYHVKTYETGPGYGTSSAGKTYPVLTRFNIGVNATLGYEWQDGWFLRGYYQRVLTSMYSDAIYETYATPAHAPILTNFNFGITAGYFFKLRSGKKQTEAGKQE
ncbi:MAG: PorT family protein [Taibaiella sp.]|nr:PorT family protein [Taibaiella sp.]